MVGRARRQVLEEDRHGLAAHEGALVDVECRLARPIRGAGAVFEVIGGVPPLRVDRSREDCLASRHTAGSARAHQRRGNPRGRERLIRPGESARRAARNHGKVIGGARPQSSRRLGHIIFPTRNR